MKTNMNFTNQRQMYIREPNGNLNLTDTLAGDIDGSSSRKHNQVLDFRHDTYEFPDLMVVVAGYKGETDLL